jgi:dTDP-4-amino-4,6-dideoxygalactose transaminase/carbonic anhydrase/acetyltransferase-like protein (isoleucine patch superfamily)
MSKTIHPNVQLGRNVVIEEYAIVGYPPKGKEPGELPTVIGDESVIRSHSVVYAGCVLGKGCHVAHGSVIREETTLGDGSSVGVGCIIEHHCRIGRNVRFQAEAGLCEYTIVEDDAWIGPRATFCNVYHPTCDRAKECLAGPIIRRKAIIGANAVICPDVEVGEGALVGAGSVVTHAVENGAVVFGNPAKKISSAEKLTCRYDMMGGKSPYAPPELNVKPPPRIPLADLAAQHQSKKEDLRLAMDRVVLNTRFINGPEVKEFEKEFATFCGVGHCVGVSSGTDALALALRACGVGHGDEVITTPHTFIATAEAILMVGARPVFADIDERTYNLDPQKVKDRITSKTRAIIPVHLYGRPAPMDEIIRLAAARGIRVIGDAAQAHGAELGGRKVAQWGDVSCFSFFPGKNLGAYGDAGAVATDDAEIAKQVALVRDHGRTEKYKHQIIGGNHRLDTLQAAVLLVKLKYLAKWNDARVRVAAAYRDGLKGLPLRLPQEDEDGRHVYHQFVLRLQGRDRLREHLDAKGVATGIHYPIPLHLQPALENLGYRKGDFPVTERAADEVLSLPMYPELTDKQVARVVEAVRSFF